MTPSLSNLNIDLNFRFSRKEGEDENFFFSTTSDIGGQNSKSSINLNHPTVSYIMKFFRILLNKFEAIEVKISIVAKSSI